MLPLPVRLQFRQQVCLRLYRKPFLRGYLVAGYRAKSPRHHVRHYGHPHPYRIVTPIPGGDAGDPELFQKDAGVGKRN